MERGSAKHGPLHDDELAHEREPMVRGAPQRAHEEEWRETEPLADRIAGLPAGRRYGNVHDVLVALGMSSPENW